MMKKSNHHVVLPPLPPKKKSTKPKFQFLPMIDIDEMERSNKITNTEIKRNLDIINKKLASKSINKSQITRRKLNINNIKLSSDIIKPTRNPTQKLTKNLHSTPVKFLQNNKSYDKFSTSNTQKSKNLYKNFIENNLIQLENEKNKNKKPSISTEEENEDYYMDYINAIKIQKEKKNEYKIEPKEYKLESETIYDCMKRMEKQNKKFFKDIDINLVVNKNEYLKYGNDPQSEFPKLLYQDDEYFRKYKNIKSKNIISKLKDNYNVYPCLIHYNEFLSYLKNVLKSVGDKNNFSYAYDPRIDFYDRIEMKLNNDQSFSSSMVSSSKDNKEKTLSEEDKNNINNINNSMSNTKNISINEDNIINLNKNNRDVELTNEENNEIKKSFDIENERFMNYCENNKSNIEIIEKKGENGQCGNCNTNNSFLDNSYILDKDLNAQENKINKENNEMYSINAQSKYMQFIHTKLKELKFNHPL